MTRGTVAYIGQRFVLIVLTAVLVSSIVFIGIHQLPGNAFLNERRSSPQQQAQQLHRFGLDKPWPQQYASWLTGVVHGDLGVSLKNPGVKITPLLIREAGVSATLGAFAMLFTILVGMTLGVSAAVRQNSWVDYAASFLATVGYSVPNFVVAFIFI